MDIVNNSRIKVEVAAVIGHAVVGWQDFSALQKGSIIMLECNKIDLEVGKVTIAKGKIRLAGQQLEVEIEEKL